MQILAIVFGALAVGWCFGFMAGAVWAYEKGKEPDREPSGDEGAAQTSYSVDPSEADTRKRHR
jgi:hypothetical protein